MNCDTLYILNKMAREKKTENIKNGVHPYPC